MKLLPLLAAAILGGSLGLPAAPEVAPTPPLRLEAERADVSRFPVSTAFAPRTDEERAVLSGGDWLAYLGTEGGEARLEFDVPGEGERTFELWVRDFGGGWQYRFDDGEWQTAAGHRHTTHVVVREADRYFTATWRRLEDVPLAPGKHTLSVRRDPASTRKLHFAIDCFDLRAPGSRAPQGWWAGDDLPAVTPPPGWIVFSPGPLAEEPAQLGPANVKPAGRQGRIVRRGDRLVFEGSDEPVRLWGVTASERHLFSLRDADMRRLARLLAAGGVNFVRIHGAPYLEETPGPLTDGIQRFVAALKAGGIYVGLDWICTATDRVQAAWGIPGFAGGEGIQNLTFFSEAYRERLRARGRNLLLAPNPHTGIPLAKDPAVGFVLLVDEDSPFFWTFVPAKMPAPFREDIERQFAAWAAKEHGSLDAALKAWGKTDLSRLQGADAPAEGRLALYPSALLTGQSFALEQRNAARAGDQAAFMADAARQAYADLTRWLREDIGYGGVVLASNWKTADERVLGGLEQLLYSAADATARNTYFAPERGKTGHFPWMPGDHVRSRSLLREPRDAIATHPQLEDYPHLFTEGGYENPNRYRAEEPLLIAAYYALQGVDAYIPFQLEPDWNLEMVKWPFLTPVTFGQSPAAAFIYRRGDVREGEVVFRDATPLDDLRALRGGQIDVAAGLDEIQTKNAGEAAANGAAAPGAAFDPLAFYVGRVTRDLRPEAKPLRSEALTTRIDLEARTVRSVTDELAMDWGRGVLTINTPRAQAAVGFFETAETDAAAFTQKGPHGAMALVSTDDQPLTAARTMLLQVMTEEKSVGFATEPGELPAKKGGAPVPAERIVANGRAPLLVREVAGQVRLKFPDATKLRVTALDHAGQPRPDGAMTVAADGTLTLRPDTFYYRLER